MRRLRGEGRRVTAPDEQIKLTRAEAQQVARFVIENSDRLPDGFTIGRYSNGRLKIEATLLLDRVTD